MMLMVNVQPTQVVQWTQVLAERCFDPRKTRTNRDLAGNYKDG